MDYEKLLIKAKEAYNKCATNAEKRRLETIFPELKESEDERIRKTLIDFVEQYGDNYYGQVAKASAISWLEKQGDYNRLVEEIKERKELLSKEKEKATSANDRLSLGGRIAMLEELLTFIKEKQGEQKPIEPKFKVGDIVKHKKNPHLTYVLESFTDEGDYVFFAIREDGAKGDMCIANVKYQDEWELVEQNPDWSEEDEKYINDILAILGGGRGYRSNRQIEEWLKSLKSQPHWKPTEEQMNELEKLIVWADELYDENSIRTIESLYNDIKKL